MSEHATDTRPRKSLRESVCDIDRDILRLLMRRHNLLRRMYNAKGHLDPAEEKFLREAREAAASFILAMASGLFSSIPITTLSTPSTFFIRAAPTTIWLLFSSMIR